jgi:hypothetical protein
MTRIGGAGLLLLAVLVSPSAVTQAGEWGDLRGHFKASDLLPPRPAIQVAAGPCAAAPLDDESVVVDALGNLRNVVVALRKAPAEIAPSYAVTAGMAVLVDFRCQPLPHVIALRTSQRLQLRNVNAFNVGLQFDVLRSKPQVPALAPGKLVELKFNQAEPQPVRFTSQTHPWITGWVVVSDHPYTAISAADGTFTIHDLPAGVELEFTVWHEKVGAIKDLPIGAGKTNAKGRFKATLRPGANDLGEIFVPIALLK